MAPIPTAFVEFREVLSRHVRELERAYPERYTTTWFFLRYLKRVSRRAFGSDSPQACNAAMRGLIRFYVDAIEDDAELTWRFEEVLESHRWALRIARRR